uniref:Clathrin/coatomer adaptor adaptin-like N-terminal domain-containing protein n=1 Tax=Mycena chlorophos TaxID=658473 RepID=A0ABQ0M338_MYCCL|nr:predicted protein [Mycena chlorophos]
MDVPFASSGAFSSAQYSLVRSVEDAPSPEIADSYLLKEVDNIRYRLRHPSISVKEVKECLLLLLYCSVSVAYTPLPALNFAIPHAVNLAEVAQRAQDKRIGYLFCAEIMPREHELRLMLVNTLRKDLESPSEARVSLALDNLVASPSAEVIPAVQTRLHDLLSNNSPHVRRRALLATCALSEYEPDILSGIKSKILQRIEDPHPSVASAAVVTAVQLVKIDPSSMPNIQEAVNQLLDKLWKLPNPHFRGVLLQVLHALRVVGLSKSQVEPILRIIQSTSETSDHPLMCGAFVLLMNADIETIIASQTSLSISAAASLRPLINSQTPNDHFIFLSCLSCLDPILWAGTGNAPAVLDEWEVGRVMKLLDSSDSLIRRKTLHILGKIDAGIINSYYLQSLQTIPVDLNLNALGEYTTRLLEVIETQTQEDGELYARHTIDLFTQIEARSPRYAECVMESVVELLLVQSRTAVPDFRLACVSTLVATLANADVFLGQTMVVILTALATEFVREVAVPPVDVLRGISTRLGLCSITVQDACLLAMLRVSVECDQVPSDVLRGVDELRQRSKRHIRQRCEEFASLSARKSTLAAIVDSADSASLPDFLIALHRHNTKPRQPPDSVPEPSSPSTSRPPLPPSSQLRYTAYETAAPRPRLRGTRSSSRASSQLSGSSLSEQDALSRTVTAGDLALAAAAERLQISEAAVSNPPATDLIALNDSPFISDPSNADVAEDFESAWSRLEESQSARGWCDAPIQEVIKRLENMESVKVISGDGSDTVKVVMDRGALRLQGTEGTCLWRLRTGDVELQRRVKAMLE